MIRLLTLNDAALHILHSMKKIDDPTDPSAIHTVLKDENNRREFFRLQMFLRNAIDAEILPAVRKPKAKAEEKKLYEQVGIPAEVWDILPKSHDLWVNWEDLAAFMEMPARLLNSAFSHSREALARTAWVLAKKVGLTMEPTRLYEELDELVIDVEADGTTCQLGENTLKGCAREILAAGKSIESEQD